MTPLKKFRIAYAAAQLIGFVAFIGPLLFFTGMFLFYDFVTAWNMFMDVGQALIVTVIVMVTASTGIMVWFFSKLSPEEARPYMEK